MKTLTATIMMMLAIATSSFAIGKDDILGKWLSEKGNAQVQIFKKGNKFFGKIIWLKEPLDVHGSPKKDKENPDNSQKSRPILGLEMLQNFVFDDDEWNDGTIYDPESGKTYSSLMRMQNNNKLEIKGYIGISLIGRSTIWTRVN